MSPSPGDVVILHGILWRVQRRYHVGEKAGLTYREDRALVDLQPPTARMVFLRRRG
jgi:hypothetical protein